MAQLKPIVWSGAVRQAALAADSLEMPGGQVIKRTTVASGSYTCAVGDYLIAITGTTGATITVPDNAPAGTVYVINDEGGNAAVSNITVQRQTADTIDGATSKAINVNYGALWVYSDGANWFTFHTSL